MPKILQKKGVHVEKGILFLWKIGVRNSEFFGTSQRKYWYGLWKIIARGTENMGTR